MQLVENNIIENEVEVVLKNDKNQIFSLSLNYLFDIKSKVLKL